MELLTDFELPLTLDDVLRGEGTDPAVVRSKKPAILEAASRALAEGISQLHPSAIIHRSPVLEHRHEKMLLENGTELTGPLVSRHLAGAVQVVLALTTIGAELEENASSRMSADPLLAFALDGLGSAAVEVLGEQVCLRIGKLAESRSLTASTPLSPGEPEWSVEVGQPQIFSLLDPSLIGIKLTSGGMMIPKKSISFVVGIGPDMSRDDFCEFCSFNERCRYRHG
jgi:Vitamin B12 dependent methionine synthase, activation domain.